MGKDPLERERHFRQSLEGWAMARRQSRGLPPVVRLDQTSFSHLQTRRKQTLISETSAGRSYPSLMRAEVAELNFRE